MLSILTDEDMDLLADRIHNGNCTAFLGAGAVSTIKTGTEFAERWADQYGLPASSARDLPQVAQFMGVRRKDMMFPKDEMIKAIKAASPPDFASNSEPHGVLARLPFTVYLTTNYDDFLLRALLAERRQPHRHVCCWNSALRRDLKVPKLPRGFEPNEREPLVFHFHGHAEERRSIVLTEDDYLDFLVAMTDRSLTKSDRNALLPAAVETALMGTSLVFIGYRLSDWNFRVLFRSLPGSLEKSLEQLHVAVQLPPNDETERDYLDAYYGRMGIKVYWGWAPDFVEALFSRYKERHGHD
jgi:SIR2-like domain